MSKKNIIIIVVSVVAILIAAVTAVLVITNKNVEYTVTFNSDGGTTVEQQIVNKGDKVTKPLDPTKEGYKFISWTYQNKTYDFSSEITSDIELKAKWYKIKVEVEEYIIKFNTNGGTTIENQIVEEGNKVTKPEDPTKEGYIFKGWYLKDKEYNFETEINTDLELEAKWEEVPKNNNNSNIETNNTPNGNTDDNKNGDSNSTEDNSNINNSTKNKYTVTFNTNGGSDISNQIVIEGEKVAEPTEPTKSGHTFIEWTLNGTAYNFDTIVTENITLEAKWKNNDWDIDKTTGAIIKYNGDAIDVVIPKKIDGITIVSIKENAFETTNMESLTFPSTIISVEDGAILKLNNVNLMNVYMSNKQYTNQSSWLKVFGMTGTGVSKTDLGTFIRAKLVKNSCSPSSYSSCYNKDFIYINNIEGVYSISYSTSNCGVTYYGPAAYLSTEEFKIENLNAVGYTFNGWTGSNGTTPQKDVVIPAGSTGNKNYVANCTEHTWSIELDYESHTSSVTNLDFSEVDYSEEPYCGNVNTSCKYKYSDTVTIPYNKVKKEGYIFKGWAITTYGTVEYSGGEKVSKLISKDGGILTLYAVWEKN